MFGKGSKLYSIFAMKCPRCNEGDLYKTSLKEFKGIYNMHESCTHCGQEYELEPGFFWGAMYVGYGLSSGYMLTSFALLIWGLGFSVNKSFAITIFFGLFIMPIIARLARAIWLNIYVHYNKDQKKLVNPKE